MKNKEFLNILELIAVKKQIRIDDTKEIDELIKRDQELEIDDKLTETKQIKSWISKISKINIGYFSMLQLISFVFGAICFYGFTKTYNNHPINLILFLCFYVIIPTIFFLFTILISIPIIRNIFFKLKTFNIFNIYFKKYFNSSTLSTKLKNNFIIYNNIKFSLLYFIGALTSFFFLLLFTDLSFSWSSTFNISSLDLKSITDLISYPWKNFLPEFVPNLELIESTKYYKLENNTKINVAVFSAWWKFLFLSFLVYAIFPRILLFFIFKFKYKKSLKKEFSNISEIKSILWRFSSETPKISEDITNNNSIKEKLNLIEIETFKELTDAQYFSYNFNLKDKANLKNIASEQIIKINLDINKEKDFIKDNLKSSTRNSIIIVNAYDTPKYELFDYLNCFIDDFNQNCYILVFKEKEFSEIDYKDYLQIWAHSVYKQQNNKLKLFKYE